jgi:sorbitol/mannitol transport system substrate-binding protein
MSDTIPPSGDDTAQLRLKLTRREVLKIGGTVAVASFALPLLASCGGGTTLTVATVGNSQMTDMESLVGDFTTLTGMRANFVTLPENDLRQKVTQDVAMGAGDFDLVTIGSYDTPIWARYKWIDPLDPYFTRMRASDRSQYDLNDILRPIRSVLTYNRQLYAVPFYAESSMLYYRKDLFAQHGLTMPQRPTWDQVAHFAQVLHDPAHGVYGIVLRGQPGWGANMAPMGTFINTFGGRWFDLHWNPQLTTPAVRQAFQFYANLVRDYGQPGATSDNFPECETLFATGRAAMWYDATSAAGYLEDPSQSQVSDKVGFAYAPVAVTPRGANWLWSWALAIESTSNNKDAAFQFIRWATSQHYLNLVGTKLGWGRVPPGTRQYAYRQTPYGQKPWAQVELNSIVQASPEQPTLEPVPYTGVQYIAIPEFQQLGTEVGEDFANVLAGHQTVDQMTEQAQQQALAVARAGGYLK